MNRYDPDHAPNPEQWLELDEQEKVYLAEEYHRVNRVKLPNATAHALFHVIVENQIAQNLESVVSAAGRLVAEGLSRHEAIHAIALVLTEHIHTLLTASTAEKFSTDDYSADIDRLTAKSWRKSNHAQYECRRSAYSTSRK